MQMTRNQERALSLKLFALATRLGLETWPATAHAAEVLEAIRKVLREVE